MNLHIAVVDDEASVRKSMARLLRLAGFEPRVYANGLQFLDACGVEPPACALIDVQMPGLTGTEVCERLLESGIGMPAILISANDDPEVRAMCLATGAACFLLKPVDGEELLGVIDRLLHRSNVASNGSVDEGDLHRPQVAAVCCAR